MKKVLTFGTFDALHPGHHFHLKEAKKHGDELYVVIALDETVKKIKGRLPVNDQGKRLASVGSLPYVHKAVLGHEGDKLKVIEEINPDIICLGYDQTSFTSGLKKKLAERGLHPEILKFSKSFHPEKYKSSKINF